MGQLGFYDLDSAQLSAAKGTLDDLSAKLWTTNDKALMKSAILGAVAAVNTTWAISTTAACGSGLINGAGLGACGPAVSKRQMATTRPCR